MSPARLSYPAGQLFICYASISIPQVSRNTIRSLLCTVVLSASPAYMCDRMFPKATAVVATILFNIIAEPAADCRAGFGACFCNRQYL